MFPKVQPILVDLGINEESSMHEIQQAMDALFREPASSKSLDKDVINDLRLEDRQFLSHNPPFRLWYGSSGLGFGPENSHDSWCAGNGFIVRGAVALTQISISQPTYMQLIGQDVFDFALRLLKSRAIS